MSGTCYLLYRYSIALISSLNLCHIKMCEIDANLWQILDGFEKTLKI